MTSSRGADTLKNDVEKNPAANLELGPSTHDQAGKGSETTLDPEKGDETPKEKTLEPLKNPDLVTWEGPNDPENPKNWTKRRRWAATFVRSLCLHLFYYGSANSA